MPVLLYIHGFNSSERSHKANVLVEAVAKMGLPQAVISPRLSWQPAKAIQQLEALIEANLSEGVTLIGSSLGGFYAGYLAEKYQLNAILVNPAVQAPSLLTHHLGHQENPYTQEVYELTPAHMAELDALVVEPTPERYWLMIQEGDEVLDYRAALAAFPHVARLTQEPNGDHRFVDFERFIPEILRFAQITTD
ncbi:hypothetical protein J9B83_00690 [Marinomonas sp. A79]|uniref:Esterase YqiA n=1 Tax=Marinomonas vulgaris TaxID=2823372 RepID=A0ABS5H8Z9_9GAMM|nr:YqiA/YcfP family alpha/beta fold hydrolase [Marinomonas vulgaris]MBR7887439.1 hypothetical protein [Marinomonas vulgaris]